MHYSNWDHHFVVTTDIRRSWIIESFLRIWAFVVWILAFWSSTCSSISWILSYMGRRASSVSLISFWVLAFDALYCFLHPVSSLFMASTSSWINSIDLPRGAVFWQMLWIMFWTSYNSLFVSSPPLLIIFYEVPSPPFFFLFNFPKFIPLPFGSSLSTSF